MADDELELKDAMTKLFHKTSRNNEELRKLLGVNASTVSRWINKNKRPQVKHMSAICQKLSYILESADWEELVLLAGYSLAEFPHTPKPEPESFGEPALAGFEDLQFGPDVSAAILEVDVTKKGVMSSYVWGDVNGNDIEEQIQHDILRAAWEVEECQEALDEIWKILPDYQEHPDRERRFNIGYDEPVAINKVELDVPGLVVTNNGARTIWFQPLETTGDLKDPGIKVADVALEIKGKKVYDVALEYTTLVVSDEPSQPIEVPSQESVRVHLNVKFGLRYSEGWKPRHWLPYLWLAGSQALLNILESGTTEGVKLEIDTLDGVRKRVSFNLKITEGLGQLSKVPHFDATRLISNLVHIQAIGEEQLSLKRLGEKC